MLKFGQPCRLSAFEAISAEMKLSSVSSSAVRTSAREQYDFHSGWLFLLILIIIIIVGVTSQQ